MGDDRAFARWCFDDLHIPLGAITRITDVLAATDAAIAKADLAAARAAEQELKRKQRNEREAFAAAERKRKADEKAAAAAEKARQAELERQAMKEAKKKASKQKNNAGWKRKQREETKVALATLANAVSGNNIVPFTPTPIAKTEDELVIQIKTALARRDKSREEWIDASVDLAGLLCEARARYPAHQKFSDWLDKHDIEIKPDDRAALLNLGLDMRAMRIILQQTDRTSYRYIWNEAKLQIGNK